MSVYEEGKRGDHKGIWSCPYSPIGWGKVRGAFGPLQHLTIVSKEDRLSDAEIDYLVGQYRWMRKSLGVPSGGKEAKRFLFIAPIFICIVGHFADLGERVELLIEEDVNGRRVKVNGHFEFVIKRGDKRICIVEAKKDDMEQGLAQDLLGLEVLADIDGLETVIGVVTNLHEWIFVKSCVEHVEVRHWNLVLGEDEIPTRTALSQVTTYLISLLSAD